MVRGHSRLDKRCLRCLLLVGTFYHPSKPDLFRCRLHVPPHRLFKGWEEPEPMDQPKPPEPDRETLGTAIKKELEEAKKERAAGEREKNQ